MSQQWYDRSTIAMASITTTITVLSIGGLVVDVENPLRSAFIDSAYLLTSVPHILWSTVFYPRLRKKNPRTAGLVGFGLFVLFSLAAIWLAKNESILPFSMWLILVLFSGLYGWWSTITMSVLGTLFIGLSLNGQISTITEYDVVLLIFSMLVSMASLLLWKILLKDYTEDYSKKHSLKRVLGDNVLINSIGDGVIVVDTEGVIRIFNDSAVLITGWSISEAISLNYKSILNLLGSTQEPLDDQSNPITQSQKQCQTVKNNTVLLKTHSDKIIEVDVLASPIKTDDQAIIGTVIILRDISSEKANERRRADFISTASHEMRTPVAAIEGYLALALNSKVSSIDDRAKGYLQKAHENTKRLGQLFQDLLTSARAEDGRLVNHPVLIEMSHMLEQVIEELRFTAEKKGLEISYTFSNTNSKIQNNKPLQPLLYVLVDPDRIREVIANLFDNAVKYTQSGRIEIGLSGDDNSVQFSISDTGQGIPTENIPHLFQKFYRVDNSDTRTIGGTGLGLFICKEIINLYNGLVWVESKLNYGSTFYVKLPRYSTQRALQQINMQNTITNK